MKMSQIEKIKNMLRIFPKVTLRMMAAEGILYTGRNRISDLRKDGWDIDTYKHDSEKGEKVSDNGYVLLAEPGTTASVPAPQFEGEQAVMVL